LSFAESVNRKEKKQKGKVLREDQLFNSLHKQNKKAEERKKEDKGGKKLDPEYKKGCGGAGSRAAI